MAGGGPDFETFKAKIAALGLDARVTLLGVTPARQALAQGRICVVPSLAESLPYVVLEATAAGLPVIATRVGGIAEIFGPTEPGLIPPADTAALRTAMQSAIDNPAEAAAEVRVRLAHVREQFSVTGMVSGIKGLYRELVTKR
jgi:glycosyltransferase involved in cell wall biosynthesis